MEATSLVKLARSLDQGEADAIPEKLAELWKALSGSTASASGFHAAEEVILRWLLKTMNGTSPAAERVRRWPMAWSVMGCAFQRIPLFSLAKSLADRRFLAVLQQTAKDLSKPRTSGSRDVEMTGVDGDSDQQPNDESRKRKRNPEPYFDLNVLQEPEMCLLSAEALFKTLQILLARLGAKAVSAPSNDRMGAEHVKSLFCSPAVEAMELFVPLLRICNLALTSPDEPEPFEEQAAWIPTFASLWDLHLPGPADAIDVGTHLSPSACVMLGKLWNVPKPAGLSLDSEVRRVWAESLQDFLTSTVVLPARSAFLNRKDTQTLLTTIGENPRDAPVRAAVLLRLALEAPPMVGGVAAKKNNERWVQTVFEKVEEPLRALGRAEKSGTMTILLGMSAEHGISPSLDSLRLVCKNYALDHNETNWPLISAIAKCDVDVFLASEAGSELLDNILARMSSSKSNDAAEFRAAADFVASLANGFARSRNLADFIDKWFASLVQSDIRGAGAYALQRVGYDRSIRNAVAGLIQPSLTKDQLLAILDRLSEPQGAAADVARLVVSDAVAAGVDAEEYTDAMGTRLLKGLFEPTYGRDWPPEILPTRWRLVRRTLSWVNFEAAAQIWNEIKEPLAASLTKYPIFSGESFEAFTCSFVVWTSLIFSGQDEADARTLTLGFLERLDDKELFQLGNLRALDMSGLATMLQEATGATATDDNSVRKFDRIFDTGQPNLALYITWMLCASSRFIDLVTKNCQSFPKFLEAVLFLAMNTKEDSGQSLAETVTRLIFANPTNLENTTVMHGVIQKLIVDLEAAKEGSERPIQAMRGAVKGLLHVPTYRIPKSSREELMQQLFSLAASEAPASLEDWEPLLDLMVRMAREPMFYRGMKFVDLVTLGTTLFNKLQDAGRDASLQSAYEAMTRLRIMAESIMRQMVTAMNGCKKHYLAGIGSFVSGWESHACPAVVRIALLDAVLSVVEPAGEGEQYVLATMNVLYLREQLVRYIVRQVKDFLLLPDVKAGTTNGESADYIGLLVALDASKVCCIEDLLDEGLHGCAVELKEVTLALCSKGVKLGWKLRAFLANRLQDVAHLCLEERFEGLFVEGGDQATGDEAAASSPYVVYDFLLDYLSSETYDYNTRMLLEYLDALVKDLEQGQTSVGRLLAIHYVIAVLINQKNPETVALGDGFDLGTAHSKLVQSLPRLHSRAQFKLAAQITALLLDKGSRFMSQWNIDSTLSSVAVVCASTDAASSDVRASPKTFDELCRLVELVIKRHRIRLEGHFHLLVSCLQALLAYLASPHHPAPLPPRKGSPPAQAHSHWEKQAQHLSRLLELVCEPSASSVTRTQKNTLNSATEAARRSAGQHMHLFLMAYVELLLVGSGGGSGGGGLSHGVREALEPGLFAVLGIMSEETLRLAADAMDPAGRAVFRELYRRWQRFGKWKGV